MGYYSVFIIIIAGSLALSYYYRQQKNKNFSLIWYLFCTFIAIVYSGFRYDAGNDYFTYHAMVEGDHPYANIELIPRLIIEVSSYLDMPWFFFLVTSILYISSISYFCRTKSLNPEFSFLCFILMPLSYLTSFGYVRQYLGIGFFILSTSFMLDRRNILAFIYFIFAFLSHSSALIFLPILFITQLLQARVYPWWSYLLVTFFIVIFSDIIIGLSGDYIKYGQYFSEALKSTAGKKIGYICLGLFFLFFFASRAAKNKVEVFYFNVYFLCTIIYLVLMSFGEYVVRISYYLFPASYILFPMIVRCFNSRQVYFISYLLIFFGLLCYGATLYLAHMNVNRDFLLNYSFYFFR